MPPLTPPPMVLQAVPSHLAMQPTLVSPPAFVKLPPTNKSVPCTVRVRTIESTPVPTFVQVVPLHLARYLMFGLPAALVKSPPTYSVSPMLAIARTLPFKPLPTFVQELLPRGSLLMYWMVASASGMFDWHCSRTPRPNDHCRPVLACS